MTSSGNSRFRNAVWRSCCGLTVVMAVLTFTPLVLDRGSARVLGLPASLLAGLGVALVFLLLTVVAARSYPDDTDSEDSQ